MNMRFFYSYLEEDDYQNCLVAMDDHHIVIYAQKYTQDLKCGKLVRMIGDRLNKKNETTHRIYRVESHKLVNKYQRRVADEFNKFFKMSGEHLFKVFTLVGVIGHKDSDILLMHSDETDYVVNYPTLLNGRMFTSITDEELENLQAEGRFKFDIDFTDIEREGSEKLEKTKIYLRRCYLESQGEGFEDQEMEDGEFIPLGEKRDISCVGDRDESEPKRARLN